MKNMKRLALMATAVLSLTTSAKERTEHDMMGIAWQALNAHTTSMTRSQTADGNITRLLAKKQLCVYGKTGVGFVVVSRDTDFTPVLGYSDTDFMTDNMPCGLVWWLNTADNTMETMKAEGKTYAYRTVSKSMDKAATANFMDVQWNQSAPFNTLCPTINGTNAPTGCIATAMAQIMFYYQYPAKGMGNGSYSYPGYGGKTTIRKKNINTEYRWTSMKNRYTPTDKDEYNAVAQLMLDAGVASGMKYSLDGSGTNEWYAARGFVNNFCYDSLAVNCLQRELYSDEEWMSLVHTEMEAQRPVLYCGSDNIDGGHAFVLDGIDGNGMVHVNWGWGGTGNGWYDINILKPVASGQELSSGGGFNGNQAMVLGLKAQSQPDANEENTSLWATSGHKFFVRDNDLYLNVQMMFNYCHRFFNGRVDVCIDNNDVPANSYHLSIFDSSDYDDGDGIIGMGSGFYLDSSKGVTDVNINKYVGKIAPGSYTVYIGSKSHEENTYQCVRQTGGKVMARLTVDSNGGMSIGDNAQTGISKMSAGSDANNNSRVYTVYGQYLGNDLNTLDKGLYIVGGRKIMK